MASLAWNLARDDEREEGAPRLRAGGSQSLLLMSRDETWMHPGLDVINPPLRQK
jgi:hypothetical protein